jgi:hypothetical protein
MRYRAPAVRLHRQFVLLAEGSAAANTWQFLSARIFRKPYAAMGWQATHRSRSRPRYQHSCGRAKSLTGITVRQAVHATAYEGSRTLRGRVRKLARMQLGEGTALVKLQALMRQCERATERRNDLVHGIWAHEWDGEPVLLRSDHRAGPRPTRR